MTTIDNSSYDVLKNMYDTVINKDRRLFKTSNDEPTPIGCIEEMMNKVPEEFWKRRDLKILDPCCGSGNFFIVLVNKLLVHHSLKDILEKMVYFNDINKDRLNIVKQVFNNNKYRLNITEYDFLEFNTDETYDMIVGNPPYAKLLPNGKRASKNHNLIGMFIQKSLDILKERGYLVYITPDNWMSLADRNKLVYKLTALQIIHLNIHSAKRYFPKIGSSFVWFVLENLPHYKNISVEGIFNTQKYTSSVKSDIRGFIPLYYTREVQSIVSKTLDTENVKYKVETSSDLHKYTKKHLISTTEDVDHPYKLIHTPKQTVWASRPHKYQDGFKVFICTTSYYKTFVDSCGMTQSIAFIREGGREEAERDCKILSHPLYVFLNNICRYGNFNNIRVIQRFPVARSYESVYNDFGISPDEIKFIESTLSK